MTAPRLRIRTLLLAVAAVAALLAWVILPAWRYYSLPASTRSALGRMGRPLKLTGAPDLAGLLKSVRLSSVDPKSGSGIPLYVDPDGLKEAEADLATPIDPARVRGRIDRALDGSLGPIGLGYYVEDGVLKVTSARAAAEALRDRPGSARRP